MIGEREICSRLKNGFANDIEKDETEGERDADPNAVSFFVMSPVFRTYIC